MAVNDVLVVGAGLAGLAAAADLQQAGAGVLVLDKGRALGGRAATRRFEGQPVDTGAQFCTARTQRLRTLLETGADAGWARVWCHGYPLWRAGHLIAREDGHPRWTCPDGIRVLAETIGNGVKVQTSVQVTAVQRAASGIWEAMDAQGNRHQGERLLLNLPPAQLLALVGEHLCPLHRARIESVRLAPCWALVGLVEEDFGSGWPAVELEDHPSLAWVARDHTRRRPGAAPAAVVHARGDWSTFQLETEPEAVQEILAREAEGTFGIRFRDGCRLHRWRYAKPETSVGESFLWDPTRNAGVCGDWCAGGRVEGALVSGWELAGAVARQDA